MLFEKVRHLQGLLDLSQSAQVRHLWCEKGTTRSFNLKKNNNPHHTYIFPASIHGNVHLQDNRV